MNKYMNNLPAGYLIIYVMVLTFITMAIGLSAVTVANKQYSHTVDDVYRQDATYGAHACASLIAEELTDNPSLSSLTNQLIFDQLNSSQGRVSCSATISNATGGRKNANIITTMRRFASDPFPINYRMRAILQSDGTKYLVVDTTRY